jgi:glycosyltransferase involved in cell wall biosynthesis
MAMKIAVCVRAIQVGGASRIAVHLSRLFVEAGHVVTLVVEQPPSSPLADEDHGYTVVALALRLWESSADVVRRTTTFFRSQSFDIVFLVTGQIFASVQRSVAFLPDTTALVPILCGDHESVYRRVMETADLWNAAVTISPLLQHGLASRLPQKPIHCLTTGIPLPPADELAGRVAWSLPLRLLYVGRLQGKKSVLLLPAILRACLSRKLPVALTVIGDGEERALLEHACRSAGVEYLITFCGVQPHAAVYRAMQSHHALLFTSTYGEGLGLVLLEAQANGCVPVASRFPGITDFAIADGETGLLAAVGDPNAFAAQIAALTAADRWERYSHAGVERARNTFTFAEMGLQYGELASALGQGAHPLPTPRSQASPGVLRFSRRDYLPRALLPLAMRLRRLYRSRTPTGRDPHASS